MAKKDEKKVIFSELGVSGLSRFGGAITEEFLRDLRGVKGRKVFQEMEANDPTIGACDFALRQVLTSVDWRVDSPGNSGAEKKATLFVEENMQDMSHSWHSTIDQITSMLTFGWSYGEIVWKLRRGRDADPPSKHDDGLIGIRKLADRSQLSLNGWKFDGHGGIRGMYQNTTAAGDVVFIPIEKALLFRTTEKHGNPEGRSAYRNAYASWYFIKNYKWIEGVGAERDLTGLPILYAPPEVVKGDGEYATQNAALKKIIRNIRRDEMEGLLLPRLPGAGNEKAYELVLQGSPGQRQFDIEMIISRLKTEIAQTMLADFVLLGHQRVGSFALARTKQDAFRVAVLGWLDAITGVLNRHLVPRLFAANKGAFPGLIQYPQIVASLANVPTLADIVKVLKVLSDVNIDLSGEIEIINAVLTESGLPLIHPKEAGESAPAKDEENTPTDDEDDEED